MERFEEFKDKVVKINFLVSNDSIEFVKGVLVDFDDEFLKVKGNKTTRYIRISEIRDIRTDYEENKL